MLRFLPESLIGGFLTNSSGGMGVSTGTPDILSLFEDESTRTALEIRHVYADMSPMPESLPAILVCSDREVLLIGLARALTESFRVYSLGIASFIGNECSWQNRSPAAILLDCSSPEPNLLSRARRWLPGVPIIAWKRSGESEAFWNSLECEPQAVLDDSSSFDEIRACIGAVILWRGWSATPRGSIARCSASSSPKTILTEVHLS